MVLLGAARKGAVATRWLIVCAAVVALKLVAYWPLRSLVPGLAGTLWVVPAALVGVAAGILTYREGDSIPLLAVAVAMAALVDLTTGYLVGESWGAFAIPVIATVVGLAAFQGLVAWLGLRVAVWLIHERRR